MTLFHQFTKTEFQKDLNDDCCIYIFELLSLEDQISVAQTCERFNDTLSTLWQKKYRNFFTEILFPASVHNWNSKLFIKKFAVFIRSIHSTVESMKLVGMSPEEWDILKLYTYPNLIHFSSGRSFFFLDEHVLIMTEIFPNLRSFSSDSFDISGKHIEKFRYLEHLDLEYSYRVEFSNFEKILEEVPLTSVRLYEFVDGYTWTSSIAFKKFCNLTNISLKYALMPCPWNLSLFSNLKILEFLVGLNTSFVNDILRSVVNDKHNDLVEMHTFRNLPPNALFEGSYPNLEKITLQEQNVTGFISISRRAPNLREIVINKCGRLKEDDINVLLKCNQIEFISVEGCYCLFLEFKLNVEDIMKHRTSLLHFNFYNNEFKSTIEQVILKVVGESPLLKITKLPNKQKAIRSNLFRFR